jgi:hypothetical protein
MNIEKSTLVVLPVNILFLTTQMLIGVFVMLKSNQRKELKADFVKYISLSALMKVKEN